MTIVRFAHDQQPSSFRSVSHVGPSANSIAAVVRTSASFKVDYVAARRHMNP